MPLAMGNQTTKTSLVEKLMGTCLHHRESIFAEEQGKKNTRMAFHEPGKGNKKQGSLGAA